MKDKYTQVLSILKENEATRSDDNLLFIRVADKHFNFSLAEEKFLLKVLRRFNHPSVTRARRKAFENHPELNPKLEQRKHQENKVKSWAGSETR